MTPIATIEETKSPSIFINGVEVFINKIDIQETPLSISSRHFGVPTINKMESFFRDTIIPEGEYQGPCYVNKYERNGFLFTYKDFYFAISKHFDQLFFVSRYKGDFELLPEQPPEDVFFIGDMKANLESIVIGSYFKSKVMERFQIAEHKVKDFLFDILKNGNYVSVTHDHESKKPAHLFCKDKKVVFLSLEGTAAITAYSVSANESIHPSITQKIADMLQSELVQLNQHEAKLYQTKMDYEMRTAIRIAEINYEFYLNEDGLDKEDLKEEKLNIERTLAALDKDWSDAADSIRRHAIALASHL